MPGPPPKHPDQRRRRNAVPGGERVVTLAAATPVPAALPVVRGIVWHPLAVQYFESVRESGQARFFEPSDWAMVFELCLAMSKLNRAKRFGAELFSQVWNAMKDLEGTDVARRKAHLFISRPIPGQETEAPPENVTTKDRYRAKLAERQEASG